MTSNVGEKWRLCTFQSRGVETSIACKRRTEPLLGDESARASVPTAGRESHPGRSRDTRTSTNESPPTKGGEVDKCTR